MSASIRTESASSSVLKSSLLSLVVMVLVSVAAMGPPRSRDPVAAEYITDRSVNVKPRRFIRRREPITSVTLIAHPRKTDERDEMNDLPNDFQTAPLAEVDPAIAEVLRRELTASRTRWR